MNIQKGLTYKHAGNEKLYTLATELSGCYVFDVDYIDSDKKPLPVVIPRKNTAFLKNLVDVSLGLKKSKNVYKQNKIKDRLQDAYDKREYYEVKISLLEEELSCLVEEAEKLNE